MRHLVKVGKTNPIQTQSNPIQTQSNPVLSAVEWANLRKAKMNLTSLDKKSGHTRLAGVTKIVCKNASFGYTHQDCRATASFAQTRAIHVARKGFGDGGK